LLLFLHGQTFFPTHKLANANYIIIKIQKECKPFSGIFENPLANNLMEEYNGKQKLTIDGKTACADDGRKSPSLRISFSARVRYG
jgi:hypothetical protein